MSVGDGTWVFLSDGRREMQWDSQRWPEKSSKPLSFTAYGQKSLRLLLPDCRRWCSAGDVERVGQMRATSPYKRWRGCCRCTSCDTLRLSPGALWRWPGTAATPR